ncbi:MAG: 4-hydroxythreonine-4-phosphate dehydrogenase PdxA [Proteobacteria bacterium]|nr:4-hydroxythreonine-4-phosphate dehydrogenase PdxA [Pseudomonadota bacterium]
MLKHISKKYGAVRIGITQGELSGISPEIIAKTLEKLNLDKTLEVVIIATPKGKKFIQSNLKKKLSPQVEFIIPDKKAIPSKIRRDEALSCIYYGAMLAALGELDAIVTAPIDKNKVSKNYKGFSGHTGFLKDIFRSRSALMLMSTPSFKIGIMTEHLPVKDIQKNITKNRIIEAAKLMNNFLSKIKKNPIINILSLNPHSGDMGLIGREEIKIIVPAIKQLNKMGIRAVGPTPADSAFVTDTKSRYDGFIAMYHDQGMIPAKMRGLDSLVNITLGLPIIRTSPGHGVAYDIAGTGKASAGSMVRAVNQAIDMALLNRIE